MTVRRLLWLVAALAACTGGRESLVAGPTSSTAEPTTTTSGGTTTTASTTTTDVPVTVPPSSGTRVVLFGGDVLGWWDGQRWVRFPTDEPVPVVGGEDYQLVYLDHPVRSATGSGLVRGCETVWHGNPSIDIDADLGPGPGRGWGWWPVSSPVAVSGIGVVLPRPVALLEPDGYADIAQGVVEDLGYEVDGSEVVQAMRADLDGDGTDEVVVVAERYPDERPDGGFEYPRPGDHSVVFLRVTKGGGVHTEILASDEHDTVGDAPSPYLLLSRVSAIADLNGDGRMEIVLAQHYYEGGDAVVFEVAADGTAKDVLFFGCGS